MSSCFPLSPQPDVSAVRYHKLRAFQRRLRESPMKMMFKRLADNGVPRSMTERLTGARFDEPGSETEQSRAALMALLHLSEVYHVIARGDLRALRSLRSAMEAAALLGVLYEPPCMTQARIAERASWVRAAMLFAARETPPPLKPHETRGV